MPTKNSYKIIKALLFLLLLTTISNFSFAHDGRPIYIELKEVTESRYILRWKIPPIMQPGTEPEIHLKGEFCQIQPEITRPAGPNVKSYLCRNPHPNNFTRLYNPLTIKITYPIANPALSSLIHFEKADGDTINLFNGPKVLEINLPSRLTIWDYVKQYIEAGFSHILEGYDHLLFVLCLVFIARNFRGILIAISGFTVGHSLTLGLASLDLFTIRVDVVEVLIPLSIMLLAAEIVYAHNGQSRTSLTRRYPAIVATGFGLLHGFGFASALAELGLPHNHKITALFSFNIGVELGQILFVLVLIFLSSIVQRIFSKWKITTLYNQLLTQSKYTIYLVGIASGYWTIDRALGLTS
ncbi:HupE/UreJ family protein [Microbulbifer sp. A4B17]|uniref:HupE/UreJ family protein n=1 Tax=Microbulbifer sp. A4B17 TaxID=359370 RepID=UPI001300B1F8|nr:HupE/UreJ family protein [Microbulbifer sp. A4B17]